MVIVLWNMSESRKPRYVASNVYVFDSARGEVGLKQIVFANISNLFNILTLFFTSLVVGMEDLISKWFGKRKYPFKQNSSVGLMLVGYWAILPWVRTRSNMRGVKNNAATKVRIYLVICDFGCLLGSKCLKLRYILNQFSIYGTRMEALDYLPYE